MSTKNNTSLNQNLHDSPQSTDLIRLDRGSITTWPPIQASTYYRTMVPSFVGDGHVRYVQSGYTYTCLYSVTSGFHQPAVQLYSRYDHNSELWRRVTVLSSWVKKNKKDNYFDFSLFGWNWRNPARICIFAYYRTNLYTTIPDERWDGCTHATLYLVVLNRWFTHLRKLLTIGNICLRHWINLHFGTKLRIFCSGF